MDLDEHVQKNKRFLLDTKRSIRLSNNEVIHKLVPPITGERMLSFSVAVAKMRAEYIDAAFKFADSKHPAPTESAIEIDQLALCRRRFEEARDAYIALERTIELGYVTVE